MANRYTHEGNVMINSGQFWRCSHGYTHFTEELCWRCALRRPISFLRYTGWLK
jgi:hypothetical protein